MVNIILKIFIIFILIYGILPWIMTFFLGIGVFNKGSKPRQVAFTFDDGPNPNYTPQLLELLREHNIKATFFVLGSQAEMYPELILRIHREGHLIGIHNYRHRTNWLMAPWQTRNQLIRSVEIIKEITGEKPIYYRPPWGLLSIFDLLLFKQFRIVLWSQMVGDWKSNGGSKKIKDKLLKGIESGAVILLHDNGETWGADSNAPSYMIKALEDVFSEVSNQGYKCMRIDEMD